MAYWLIEIDSEVIGQEFIFKKPKRQKPGGDTLWVTRWSTSWRLAFWLIEIDSEVIGQELIF